MSRVCCLAEIDADHVPLLSSALKLAGEPALAVLARLDIVELRKLAPNVLVADVDRLEVDPLEMVRQLRFVLPDCVLVVFTSATEQSWARECHFAGATAVLSKDSDATQLADGLWHAIRSGCWTDPRFAA
jgi:DNA-binding NarL/FixJ family response regulator